MTQIDPALLDARILSAHENNDNWQLADLYALAADQKRGEGDSEAAGFLFTQAYVYALDSAHPKADTLRKILIAQGREQEE